MTVVLGIDMSLTGTGLAAVTSDGGFTVTTEGSTGKRGDTLADRDRRLADLARRIGLFVENWDDYTLAVIEGPAIMAKGGSNWDRAGLWWLTVYTALDPARTAVAAPTTVKKWAAGKGSADKAAVAGGVTRLWPEFECGSDNEADALALASMGAQRLGWRLFPKRAHHSDALLKVEWPAFVRQRDEDRADRLQELTADAAGGDPT
jgi:Holliday junction resolvasome RuvABC endonuclease subunit